MAGPTTAERGERQRRDAAAQGAPPGPAGRPRLRLPRPRPRLLVLLLALAVLLAAGAVWLFYGSPWLRVRQVTVSGTRVLTPGQVRDTASVSTGSPLASVDTGAVEDQLRRSLPRIESVDVTRSWPHGIELKVTERSPVLVTRKSGKFVEVDGKGVGFATVAKAPAGVPVLELTASGSPSLNRFGTADLVRAAVRVAGDLPDAVARDTRVVRVRSYDAVTLELTKGRTVDWGSSEKGAAKGRTLVALMKAAPKAGHFDVSAPTAPASSAS